MIVHLLCNFIAFLLFCSSNFPLPDTRKKMNADPDPQPWGQYTPRDHSPGDSTQQGTTALGTVHNKGQVIVIA